jgi:hypothetical protein
LQHFKLLIHRRKPGRGLAGAKKCLRQRLKRQHHHGVAAGCQFPATIDQRLVPKVDSVEITDGHNRAPARAGPAVLCGSVSDQLHGVGSVPQKTMDYTSTAACESL